MPAATRGVVCRRSLIGFPPDQARRCRIMRNANQATRSVSRRAVLAGAFAAAGWAAFSRAEAEAEERAGKGAPVARKDPLKITRLETFLVQPRWLFLKVHTNAGI